MAWTLFGRGRSKSREIAHLRARVEELEVQRRKVIATGRRSYWGAQSGRLAAGMASSPRPIDADIYHGVRVLRARSRELAQNSDHVKGFLRLLTTNVVGHTGLQIRARVPDNRPGSQPNSVDRFASEALERAWQSQGKPENMTASGTIDYVDLLRMHIRTVARDGEAIYKKLPGWGQSEWGFALQPIDCETLDVMLNRKMGNGRRVRMGVEIDEYHRPVAYHFRTAVTADYEYHYEGGHYISVPANEIIHSFLREDATQTRGVPWVSAGVLRLNMLSHYEDAEVVAARTAASKMGFFEQDENAAALFQDQLEANAEAGNLDAYGDIIDHAEAGTFEMLPPGVSFKEWDPAHPTTAFGDFVASSLRSISVGLGVSYSSLTNDWASGSWSSQRQEALEIRALWMSLQEWVGKDFCRRVYNAWLRPALLTGIPVAGTNTLRPEDVERYENVVFQGRRWQWVDPQKEIDALGRAVSLGIKSRFDGIRELGRDPADVLDEIERERAEYEARGIPLVDPVLKTEEGAEVETTEQTAAAEAMQ